MAETTRDNQGIEVAFKANLEDVMKAMETVERMGRNPRRIPIKADMTFDEKQVARAANDMVATADRARYQAMARRQYGDQIRAAGGQDGLLSGWAGAIFSRFAMPLAAIGALKSAGAFGEAFRAPRDERAQAMYTAATGIPILGSLVAGIGGITGVDHDLKAAAAAREAYRETTALRSSVGERLYAARAGREGDSDALIESKLRGDTGEMSAKRRELKQQLARDGTDFELSSTGWVQVLNGAGKNITAAIHNLDGAIDSLVQESEIAKAETRTSDARKLRANTYEISAIGHDVTAQTGMTPSDRAEGRIAARGARFSSRRIALEEAIKHLPQDQQESERAKLEAERLAMVTGNGVDRSEAQAEQRKMAADRAQEQEAGRRNVMERSRRQAEAATTQRADDIITSGTASATGLRANAFLMQSELVQYQTETNAQLQGLAFPLMSTRNLATRRAAGEQEIRVRQGRARFDIRAGLAARRDMAGASGAGYGELAGVIGTIAGMGTELRTASPEFQGDIAATQLADLRGMRENFRRPRSYAQFGDALSEAAGGPGGQQGDQMVKLLERIETAIKERGGGFFQ